MSEQMVLSNYTLLNTTGVVGVYDFATANCSNFRSNGVKTFFKVWPEDSMRYCCEETTGQFTYSLRNFTYGKYGARLISRPYFDLGNVDFLSPYWKQYRFWQVPQRQIILERFKCEYTDLQNLYSHRFWTKVLGEGVLTAFIIILILQTVVVLFVIFKWAILWRVSKETKIGHTIRENMTRWWLTKIKLEDWISDLVHIALVTVVGSGLIEAIGHSSPIGWRPIIFYNAAVVYAWLTLVCLVSSMVRQIAVSAFDEDEDEARQSMRHQLKLEKEYVSLDRPVPKNVINKMKITDLALSKISEDWRWQRVFGQLATVILVGTYVRFVDDDSGEAMDNIAALVLAALVVASMWSGGVGLVVTFRNVFYIARHLRTVKQKDKPEDRVDLERIGTIYSWHQASQGLNSFSRHQHATYSLRHDPIGSSLNNRPPLNGSDRNGSARNHGFQRMDNSGSSLHNGLVAESGRGRRLSIVE